MANEKLSITKYDLNSPYIEERLITEKAARRELTREERTPAKTSFVFNPIFYTAVAGTFGAVIPWVIGEPFVYNTGGTGIGGENINVLYYMTVAFPVAVGLCISSVDGLCSGNISKAIRNGGIGLALGLIWGVVGTFLANKAMEFLTLIGLAFIPGAIMKENPADFNAATIFVHIIARTFAWALLGLGIGIGPGIASSSKKVFYNGIIGGLLGGYLGGLLFDPIYFSLLRVGFDLGGISRLLGNVLIGTSTGLFVGYFENTGKKAWVVMKTGALRGKQFVIYHDTTVIGSSPRCDIYIFKDPKVEPVHAEIRKFGNKFEIIDKGTTEGIYVNGNKVSKRVLEKGDNVVIGESLLEFQQKDIK